MDTPSMTADSAADVILALGSNLGDRVATLAQGIREIADIDGFELTGIAPLYESAAVKLHGVDHEAPSYVNTVVAGRYTGTPQQLLVAVNAIENSNGRVRTERWGDRTLDIDIIVVGDVRSDDDTLTIPHPRAAERDFVLVPWLDIDPDAVLPGHGRVADLLAQLEITVAPLEGTGT
jgi:2-amino-4-hydroxy-6-hydroxymethyldihydropteridine diphosphokinase